MDRAASIIIMIFIKECQIKSTKANTSRLNDGETRGSYFPFILRSQSSAQLCRRFHESNTCLPVSNFEFLSSNCITFFDGRYFWENIVTTSMFDDVSPK